jgi:hippurate hydrolase
VPDEATVSLGLRSLSEPALEAALAEVRALAAHAAAAAGCPDPPRLRVTGRAPVQHNDEATAAAVLRAHSDVLGPSRVLTVPPSTAAEDFPLFGADGRVPTAYWSVGGTGARAWAAAAAPGAPPEERIAALPVNHSPSFAPDPVPTLRTATTAAAAAALALLDPA